MIRETRPCLFCGHPIELICVETEDVGKFYEIQGRMTTIHEEEIGWRDVECEQCDLYVPPDLVEARYHRQLDGYWINWASMEDMWNWFRIFLQECPEAQRVAREVLEKC